MKNFYLDLANLNSWANKRFRNSLNKISAEQLQISTPYGPLIELAVHIFAAVELWLTRIGGDSPKKMTSANDFKSNDLIWDAWTKADKQFLAYIQSITISETYNQVINYTSTEGDKYSASIGQILSHVSHHQMYHRGQIAMALRQNNLTPVPASDAIYYFVSKE